jgi:hypothetical protein
MSFRDRLSVLKSTIEKKVESIQQAQLLNLASNLDVASQSEVRFLSNLALAVLMEGETHACIAAFGVPEGLHASHYEGDPQAVEMR